MTCPGTCDWDLLAMDLVDDTRAETLLAHARSCPVCRERFQAARRDHIDRMRMYEAFDRDHDELREQLLAVLPEVAPAPRAERWVARTGRRLGALAMTLKKSDVARAAAVLVPAACIVIAAVLLLTPGRSAFAAAIEHLRQARTIVVHFQAFVNRAETPMQTGTLYLSDEHGMRFDAAMPMAGGAGMTMLHREGEPILLIQPAMKCALRMHVPAGFSGFAGDWQQNSPDAFLRGFRKLTGEADGYLGRSVFDGQEVEGFEVSARKLGLEYVGGPASPENGASGTPAGPTAARLWVDARTHLPVRMEVEVNASGGPLGTMHVKVTYDEFRFDTPLAPELFTVEIPEGMRVVDVTVPARTEQTLLKGLRLYAEAAGRYPLVLDPSRVTSELMVARAAGGQVQFDPSDLSTAFAETIVQDAMTIAMGCNFVQQLARDGREPEYFGDVVTPEDADQVLLRWRLADGQVRVIYGDLRVETVAPAD